MKIETQELAKYLFDYHEDGYLIWKNNQYKRFNGKKVYFYFKNKYKLIRYKEVPTLLHRVIFLWHHGWLPEKIDHEDRNPSNNRIGNLREATALQNRANSLGKSSSTSKYKGVCKFIRRSGGVSWDMQFFTKKIIISKRFRSEIQAALEYNKLAVKYHKEFAYLNIIQPIQK